MNRILIVAQFGHARVDGGAFLCAQRFDPFSSSFGAGVAPVECARDRGQDRADVADHSQIDIAVSADGRIRHVDLHDGLGLEALAVTQAEIEGRADDDDDVGFGERIAPRKLEVQRMAGRKRSASGAVHIRRNVELLNERLRGIGPAARPHLLPE